MCSKREPFHALLPLLRHVVPLNDWNCRLIIPVVKGRCAREALPHAFNIGCAREALPHAFNIRVCVWGSSLLSLFRDSFCHAKNRIMYVILWWTVYILTQFTCNWRHPNQFLMMSQMHCMMQPLGCINTKSDIYLNRSILFIAIFCWSCKKLLLLYGWNSEWVCQWINDLHLSLLLCLLPLTCHPPDMKYISSSMGLN